MFTFSSSLQSTSFNCEMLLDAVKMSSNCEIILMPLYLECFHSSKTLISSIWRVQIVYCCKISPPTSKASAGEMGPHASEHPQGIIRDDATQTCLCTLYMAVKSNSCSLLSAVWSSWIILYRTQIMASTSQPHILGSGPARSRGRDNIARHVLRDWAPTLRINSTPPRAVKGTPTCPQSQWARSTVNTWRTQATALSSTWGP